MENIKCFIKSEKISILGKTYITTKKFIYESPINQQQKRPVTLKTTGPVILIGTF